MAVDGHPESAIPATTDRPPQDGPIDPGVQIGHAHLKVADLDRARRFYGDTLGFETQAEVPGALFLGAGGYHHHLGLNTWESGGSGPPPRFSTGLFHTAIRYPTRAALADALGRLVRARVQLDGAADHGVSEALYLTDPDGNGVELYWDRPREQWPRTPTGELAMVTLPLDLRDLLAAAPGTAAEGTPIDPGTDIGHVHLKVSDIDRSLAFYRDTLGLELQQRFGPQAAFVSAGGYHHHLGLNTWESRGAGPPPPGHTGIYHHALRYPTRAALADALRRLLAAGHAPLGASDHGVSEAIYTMDPDGIGVELYRDRPRDEWQRGPNGSAVEMGRAPLDLAALLAES